MGSFRLSEWKKKVLVTFNCIVILMEYIQCYEVHLSENKIFRNIFDASLNSVDGNYKWIYSIEPYTERTLRELIDIDSSGTVVMKRIFNCSRTYSPINFNILSQAVSHQNHLTSNFTILPISLFIKGKHCRARIKTNNSFKKFIINMPLIHGLDNCLNSKEKISLFKLLPEAWKACDVSLHVLDNSRFKVIPNSLTLETTSKLCITEKYSSLKFLIIVKCTDQTPQKVPAKLILQSTTMDFQYSDPEIKRRGRVKRAYNNPPRFERETYSANIMEGRTAGVVVTRITASDVDSGDDGLLSYALESRRDTRSNSMFAINSITGTINTTQKLDRESIAIHNFTVLAVDHGHIPKTAVCLLTIRVDDKNDHAPQFEQNVYSIDLSESIGSGHPVMSVQATDIDAGENAYIRYSILNPANPNDAFLINPNTGSISTRHKLDRETLDSYKLIIQAMDQGPIDTRLSSTATVFINIQDENDNRPQFTQETYSVEVSEDLNTSDHPVIIKISATDADEGDNGRVTYSITSMYPQGSFSIDAHSGDITPLDSFDYETTKECQIFVRAQDFGTPPLGNMTQVVIKVTDVNDNDPSFWVPSYQTSVFENTPVDVSVVQVLAHDSDSGKNHEIVYSIKDIPPNFPFSINQENGIISTKHVIDRESVSSYNFVVLAKDQGVPPRSATVSVGITIKDINDNAPHFTQSSYEASISEIASRGASVVTVSAVDSDAGENSQLAYRITSGNTNSAFSISYVGGDGLITILRELNYKLQSSYILTVSATDSGGKEDTAEVRIDVIAANRFHPVFQQKTYHMNVYEDVDVGTSVFEVLALDNDVGENARVTYAIENTAFSIDPDTGIIRTRVPLDRETTPGYSFRVTASDHGIPPNSITNQIGVTVVDVNDNKPEFTETKYSAAVFEDVHTVTSVLQISAIDKDQYENGQVYYTFQGGNDGNGDFSIDETSGIIRVNKPLDRETIASYDLLAYAIDRGEPAQSSSVSIAIRVKDINDNRPRFKSDVIHVSIVENKGIGATVASISADDPDEGINAELEYRLLTHGDGDLFELVGRPGEPAIIKTKVDFDYEKPRKSFEIVVRASSATFFSDASIIVSILDINDNIPILNDFSIIVNNYPNKFPSSIGRIPAVDPDDIDKDNLVYTILSGNDVNWLTLNQSSGELALDSRLNSDVQRNRTFVMGVTDGKNFKKATCHLFVQLITKELLSHSVTIRMSDMTQAAFMSPLYKFFVSALASIIHTEEKNIFVVNIQNDTDVQTQVLNVSLSIRRSTTASGDDVFFPAEYIREQVYLQRALLANLSTLQVLPFDDNLCLIEPCENFKVCNTGLMFMVAGEFLSSDTMLFRPIATSNWLPCTCPPGFTGMTSDFVCDVEVNLCYSSPCMNGGSCMRTEGGYSCLCADNFAGKNCEVNLTNKFDSLTCPKQLCAAPSFCQPLIKNGFRCEECLGTDYNRFCQQTTRSFPKGSYLTYRSLKNRHRFNIQLTFATQESSGLLFYNGRFNGQHDFIALEIIDGQLQFSFSLGANVTRVRSNLKKGVNTGEWQKVTVDYLNRTVTMTVGEDCDTSISLLYGNQLGNYSCAVRATHNLEDRCSIPSNLCARLLDLSGPLQIGGLPSLPSPEQVQSKDFNGCIKNFYVDYQLLDFNTSVSDKGTQRGCAQRGNYCRSSPCKHGGTCHEGWGTYICSCRPRTGGKDCSLVIDPPFRLQGNGYVLFTENVDTIHFPWYNGISFRTRSTTGTLMQIVTESAGTMLMELVDGYITYTYKNAVAEFDIRRVNDGKWHYFETRWFEKGQFVMVLDYGDWKKGALMPAELSGRDISRVYIGAKRVGSEPIQNGFDGCIGIMRVANNADAHLVRSRGRAFNIVANCTGSDVCQGNPCGYPNTCVDEWESYSCKCAKGRIGDSCQEVCTHYNPCKNFAPCRHPTDGEESYHCECGKRQTGKYCENEAEQPCPATWWGFPVCGPCNCDKEKGFDPRCNKDTGKCQCQDKHYSPGDGVCYPCDCEYPLGSQNTSCDPVSGQCYCLTGAVGRRCDQCSSKYAEIEKDGCKVVYDSCPMNLAAGVWWERTVFGETRIQDCPYGAQGDAKRKCSEDDVWGSPDLFNCTNNLFVDLSDQIDRILTGELILNRLESQTLATQLLTATMRTSPMLGNDIYIAYRLTREILLHENKQKGLDLASEHGLSFIRNLLNSLSRLLDPKYEREWNRVNLISGGANELMLMLENYLLVLAKSMSQSDGWPYQIATDNIVLGVDSVNKLNYSGVALPKYDNIIPVDIFDKDSSIVLSTSVIKSIPPDLNGINIDKSIPKAYVGYILYKNMGNMLPRKYDSSVRVIHGRPVSVNSPVLSIVVSDENREIGKLKEPVKIFFKQKVKLNRTSPQCVFWKNTSSIAGTWSSEGCRVKDRATMKGDMYVICECDHMTSFALLMDEASSEYVEERVVTFIALSYVLLPIALVIMAVTVFILFVLKKIQSNANSIHVNMIVVVFISMLAYLIGIDQTSSKLFCRLVAIALHYFYMAAFSWMFVEVLHLYRMLTEIRDVNHGSMKFYYLVGYVIPGIIVSMAVGLNTDGYNNNHFCWLSMHDLFIWSFAGPVTFVVVLNILTFALAVRASCREKVHVSDLSAIRVGLLSAILFQLLLGVIWIIGLLSVNEDVLAFHYLFAIFSFLQGIFVFVAYIVFSQKVKFQLKKLWYKLRGKKLEVEENVVGTRSSSRSALAYAHTSVEGIINRINVGISTTSTTSKSSSGLYKSDDYLKSTTTSTSGPGPYKPSAPPYDYDPSAYEKGPDDPDTGEINHKRSNDSDSDSELSVGHGSLDLASSHSSDDDDDFDIGPRWDRQLPKNSVVEKARQQLQKAKEKMKSQPLPGIQDFHNAPPPSFSTTNPSNLWPGDTYLSSTDTSSHPHHTSLPQQPPDVTLPAQRDKGNREYITPPVPPDGSISFEPNIRSPVPNIIPRGRHKVQVLTHNGSISSDTEGSNETSV